MAISPYLAMLRSHVGHGLLLMPAVAAIIRNERREVLFMRAIEDGRWSLPAGSVDPGETPAAAVIREVREETGLEVEAVGVIGVFGGPEIRVQYANGDLTEYVTIVFECRVVGGALTVDGDETAELAYFSVAQRPDTPFPEAVFASQASSALFNR